MNRKFFLNGEYTIIRTLPRTPRLYIESTSFNFKKISKRYETVDRGADYESFVLRQYFQGKFYRVNKDGSRGEVSLLQNWKLDEEYESMHYQGEGRQQILVCRCSYPYFSDNIISYECDDTPDRAGSQAVTCLVGDSGREISRCPNCNRKLIWNELATKNTLAKSKTYEYAVMQSYPLTNPLIFVITTHNYDKAHSTMQLENMSSDYKCFVLRIIDDGKLYKVAKGGEKGNIDLVQNWQIAEMYSEMSERDTNDAAILRCECSYPYYTSIAVESSTGRRWAEAMPVTCLVEDNGREITHCPNCGRELFEEEENYPEVRTFETPEVCMDCQNYYGKSFNGTHLICAIYPHGWNGDECPDYSA